MPNQGDQPTWNARALQIIQSNPAWGVDAFITTGILDYDNVADPTVGGADVTFYQNSLAPIKNNTPITTGDWKQWGQIYSAVTGNPPAVGSGAFQSRLAQPRILNVPTGRAILFANEVYTPSASGAFRFIDGFETGDFSKWDTVSGANITVVSGAGVVHTGSFAADVKLSATVASILKNFASPANQYYGRIYIQPVTVPQALTTFVNMQTVTGGNFALIRLDSTNKIVAAINDVSGGSTTNQVHVTVTTNALTVGSYYRVEWFVDFSSATQGALSIRVYNSAGTLLYDTSGSPLIQPTAHYIQTNMNGIKIGATNSNATSGEFRLDDLQVNAASLGWVGV